MGYILCHGNVTNFDTMIRHFTTSIKSILIFSSKKIRFRIVTDDLDGINDMIFENIPEKYWPDFDVRGDNTSKDMWDLKDSLKFKGCGHLKMTFHHTFGDVDSLLLLDADTLLLNPIEGIALKSVFHSNLFSTVPTFEHLVTYLVISNFSKILIVSEKSNERVK